MGLFKDWYDFVIELYVDPGVPWLKPMRIKKNKYEQTQNESYTWFKKLPTFIDGNKKKALLRKLGNYNDSLKRAKSKYTPKNSNTNTWQGKGISLCLVV